MNRLLIYILFLSLFAISCQTMKEKGSRHEYVMKNFRLESDITPKGSAETTYYEISYPEFKDEKISRFIIDSIILDSGNTSVEEMGKSFINDFEDYARESTHQFPWFEQRTDSVSVQTSSYIGIITKWSNYTGGAHGTYATIFHNYDVKASQSVPLNAVIPAGKMPQLTATGEEIFRKQENLTPEQSLKENYFFEDGQFSLPDNYIFTSKGLLFLYNIYEIKPYVSGQTELLLPYAAVLPLMSEKGKEIAEEVND